MIFITSRINFSGLNPNCSISFIVSLLKIVATVLRVSLQPLAISPTRSYFTELATARLKDFDSEFALPKAVPERI